LQNVITGPEGDTTITVTGNVEFKETIKVTKKKGNGTDVEKMENFFFEVRVRQKMKSGADGEDLGNDLLAF
jgi:hypothetical protein